MGTLPDFHRSKYAVDGQRSAPYNLPTFMKNFYITLLSSLLTIFLQATYAANRPNVILIMTDDQGFADLSVYGHDQIKTPRLDALAKEGLRLTSFYSGAAVCTPSRMALLTGAYPARLGWKRGVGVGACLLSCCHISGFN